jgi:hypothetical protein
MSVPRNKSRNGKHKQIVSNILFALEKLPSGMALQIATAQFAERKDGVRSALYREARKSGRKVATAIDANSLYVWIRNKSC